eukprot:TRINITY_DN73257_c0_g1_i1.p2 TRINITY_DN73257_c0_g1~~TRINITY_DN73257_c0_g1_i1.p2  ORF type:complete len:170 (+),score=50.30 TRINITY_DN73257_c0_g1_i1:40-510(+)
MAKRPASSEDAGRAPEEEHEETSKRARGDESKLKPGGRDFFEAAEWGRLSQLQKFLDEGVDPNSRDPDDDPVLFTASMKGHFGIVEALLAAKADPCVQSEIGFTALMLAARKGQTEVVGALLLAGAEVETKNAQGQTALDIARSLGHEDCSEMLLM